MFLFDFDYVVLNVIMFVIFCVCGQRVSVGKSYWANAFVSSVVFCLMMGLRLNRGNDYVHYMDVYLHDTESTQLLFTWFNDFLKWFGVGPHGFFFFYAIPFIWCAFVFMKPMRLYAKYAFPCFLIAMVVFEEFMIRQALSFSFVFLVILHCHKAFDYARVNKREIVKVILWSLVSVSIHTANALVIMLIIGFYLIYRRPIKPIMAIPIYIFSAYVFSSIFDLNLLQPLVSLLGDSSDKFAGYAEHSDHWFSEDGMNDIYTRNPIIKIFETLGNISLMYFGYKVLMQQHFSRLYIVPFNLFFFGTCFQKAFRNLEILNRMGNVCMNMFFIPLTIVLFFIKYKECSSWEKCLYICLAFWLYDYFKYFCMRGEMTLFLWDKN